jgi:hypothetical protein
MGAVARRNMTITVDDDVARWARVKAAEEDTSVAQLVGEMLRQRMLEEDAYDEAMREHFMQQPVRLRESGRYPSRDEMHAR